MSTLDYAARAKSIRNKPEVNSRMTKAALLSQYAVEIERLKADVLAAREKNGIYLSGESWAELSAEHDARKAALADAKRQADIFQSQMRTTTEQFEQALRVLGVRDAELRTIGEQLAAEKGNFSELKALLEQTRQELDDETVLRRGNDEQRRRWRDVAGQAVQDVDGLRDKVARKAAVEDRNARTVEQAHGSMSGLAARMADQLRALSEKTLRFQQESGDILSSMTTRQLEALNSNHTFIGEQLASLSDSSTAVRSKLQAQDIQLSSFLQLVDATSQGILQQSQQQRAEAVRVAQEMGDSVHKGCSNVLHEAERAMKDVMTGVLEMHSSAQVELQKQADFARAKRDAEQKALQEEASRPDMRLRKSGKS
jgi:kinesin family protein 11